MTSFQNGTAGNRLVYFLIFILFFITYGYFFQGGGWNQNSRIALTRAIIDYGTFAIDRFKEDAPGMEFVNTGDWAFCGGHYYSNKSPGLSFLAVPYFALAHTLFKYILPNDLEKQVVLSAYLSTLGTVSLLSTFLCLLIFYVVCRIWGGSASAALWLSLCFGFGTLAFSYSTAFYCHQPAACCAFLSLVLAMRIRYDRSSRKGLEAGLAGFSAASAVVIEPSTIIMLLGIALYLVTAKRGGRYILPFLLGCLPPGAVLGWYNYRCFGHPLASSYHYSNDMVMWKVEGKLFGLPDLNRIYQLLISPYRGLFFTSPIVLMALPGFLISLRKREWVREMLFCALISVVFFLFIASFHAWHGGSAPGPRYLLPMFPFLFVLAGLSFTTFPGVFTLLGGISLLINLSITLVGNEIPREVTNPLVEVVLKSIAHGRVSINPVPFSNFEHYDIYQLAEIENWSGIVNHNSFNLGELLFPHSLLSLVPLSCFWMVWGWWWRKIVIHHR